MINHLLLIGVFLVTMLTVNADFTLTINFINYTNPSALCAECSTRLANFSLDQIVPVCCDQTSQTDNCNNTGEESCDTRFRWTLREFNASIQTRPVTSDPDYPKYSFNPCMMSSMCPFSETSRTFDQGPVGFLGRPNPYLANSTGPWMGRIQFYIEPNDGVPNIIDSIPVNLDTLQLGADFTEEMTYTGYHNISHMRMSFKVECSPDYCGLDCTVSSTDNPRIMSCASNGQITCVNDFDPTNNCMTFLNTEYDPATNCSTCLNPDLDAINNCTICLNNGYSIETDCSLCLPNRDLSTNCSTCLFGWDSERDCTECLPGRNMSTNCTTCLSGYTGEDCMAVTTSTTTGSTVPTSEAINIALISGIAGGVGGGALIIIVLLILIIILLIYRKTSAKFNVSNGNADNVYEHSSTDTGTGTASSVGLKLQNPIYASGSESNEVVYSVPSPLKTVTITNDERMAPSVICDYATITSSDAYDMITDEHLTSNKKEGDLPVYDVAFPEEVSYAVLDGPTYDMTDHRLHSPINPLFLLPEGMYSRVNHPEGSTSPTSHLYDYADIPNKQPSTSEGSLPSYAYKYVTTVLDTPQPPKENTSVYTNRLPGVITAEAVDHYDFGP